MEKGNEPRTDLGGIAAAAVGGVALGSVVGGRVDDDYDSDEYYDPRLPQGPGNDPLFPLDPSVPVGYFMDKGVTGTDAGADDVDPLAALPDDDYDSDEYYDPRLPQGPGNDPLFPLDPSVPVGYFMDKGSADSGDVDPLAALPDDGEGD